MAHGIEDSAIIMAMEPVIVNGLEALHAEHRASSTVSLPPVVSKPADSKVSNVLPATIEKDMKHPEAAGKAKHIIGMLSSWDSTASHANSAVLLIKSIKSAKNVNQIENTHPKMASLLLDLVRKGASTKFLTGLITTISDAILNKIIEFSIAELGSPPCKFAFMIMGSQGREEQTLVSDQDNGIVYENLDNDKARLHASEYFENLSELVCSQLHFAGYKFCNGNCIAKNPNWCQPLSNWKQYFYNWIHQGTHEDLLNSSIFFDFRGVWGELELTNQLKSYLLKSVGNWPGFLRHLTENALQFRPPIGPFRKLLVESKGEHKGSFNIKWSIQPIVDFARIYSLKHGISQTNTLLRLFQLHTRHVLTDRAYIDLIQSYNYLMRLRILKQIATIIDEEKPPDNYIDPKNLSSLDKAMLKKVLKEMKQFQQKLKTEFIGVV